MKVASLIARKGARWRSIKASSEVTDLRRRFKAIAANSGKVGKIQYEEVILLESSGQTKRRKYRQKPD